MLVLLVRDPYASVPSLAEQVGIDELAVDGILEELVADGYVDEPTERGRLVRRDRPLAVRWRPTTR